MKTIQTRMLAPTDTKGTRIVVDDGDGNRLIVPYRHDMGSDRNHARAAVELAKKMGWFGTMQPGHLLRDGRTVAVVWSWLDARSQVVIG